MTDLAPGVTSDPDVKHEFGMALGEFDEVFVFDCSVHVERMDDTAFWIGITHPTLPMLHIRTGVHRGTWYFNVEQDSLTDPQWFPINRPRSKPVSNGGLKPSQKKEVGK